MVGSFYAFAIWIGLGAGALLWYLQTKVKSNTVNILAGIVLLGVPLMMGFQNYNVHDRSNRYTAYDYASVSYTHLDVYKRQVLEFPKLKPLSLRPFCNL